MTGGSDWIYIAAGSALALASVVLGAWALFWDRSRGRERCPKCWYSLEGALAKEDDKRTCPECGRVVQGQRQLLKTQRRWRWLMVAVVTILVSSYVVYTLPRVKRDGWRGYVPTWVLIAAVDDYDSTDATTTALISRLQWDWIAPWDRHRAVRREAVLLPDDLDDVVLYRSTWPTGTPLRVTFAYKPWLGSRFAWRKISLWQIGQEDTQASVRYSPPIPQHGRGEVPPDWIDLPAPVAGLNKYELVVEVRCDNAILRRDVVTIEVEGVASPTGVIKPVANQKLMQTFLDALEFRAYTNPDDGSVSLLFEPKIGWIMPSNILMPLNLSVLHDGTEIGTAKVNEDSFWGCSILLGRGPNQWLGIDAQGNGFLRADDFVIRITPDIERALRTLELNSYLDETAEVPLREFLFMIGDFVDSVRVNVSEIPLNWPTSEDWIRKNEEKAEDR